MMREDQDVRQSCLSNVFQVSHGEKNCCCACVRATDSGDPNRTVNTERGSQEVAFLLGFLTYVMLVMVLGVKMEMSWEERHTLLEKPLAKVVHTLARALGEGSERGKERTNGSRHIVDCKY